jgi:anti-sigma regulatory factor (Ser/Thr protein kinase)
MQILLHLKLTARVENLRRVMESVSNCARVQDFDQKKIQKIELAVEEALVNIFNYAYPAGPGEVEVNCRADHDHFLIEIIDSGIPFDMTSLPDPDLTANVDDREIGGLGIYLIKKMVDEVRYDRESGRNILSLTLKKNPPVRDGHP